MRRFISVLVVAAAACSLCSTQEKADFNRIIEQKNMEYRADPFVNTKAGISARRSHEQDQILQEFGRCPECFLKKYVGAQRTYLFDAITDCETMRAGTAFDGGKWLCSPQSLPAHPIVYSFGIGDNISFDMDMAGWFGSDVFMFDPSPSVVAGFHKFANGRACGRGRLFFEAVGLGPVADRPDDPWKLIIEGRSCAVKGLAEIARAHSHDHVDILKIDIEGGEFPALKNMLASNTLLSLQVRQLLIEFHIINDQAFAAFVRIVGELKRQGFLLFRKEFNPYAAATCAEYAFVRR